MKKIWIDPLSLVGILLLFLLLTGCQAGERTPAGTPDPFFIPPTSDPAGAAIRLQENNPTPTRQTNCENQLQFQEDLTIPDGSEVEPGQSILKRWLVKNTGTCNWDQSYTFQLISGLALGAEKIQALYPARQSTDAVLEIQFTAPDNPGRYNSWWQAYGPDGNRFGDPVYMEILVVNK